jgi:hypothetical protein
VGQVAQALEQRHHLLPVLALKIPLVTKRLRHAQDGLLAWLGIGAIDQPVQVPQHGAKYLGGHRGAALCQ